MFVPVLGMTVSRGLLDPVDFAQDVFREGCVTRVGAGRQHRASIQTGSKGKRSSVSFSDPQKGDPLSVAGFFHSRPKLAIRMQSAACLQYCDS